MLLNVEVRFYVLEKITPTGFISDRFTRTLIPINKLLLLLSVVLWNKIEIQAANKTELLLFYRLLVYR